MQRMFTANGRKMFSGIYHHVEPNQRLLLCWRTTKMNASTTSIRSDVKCGIDSASTRQGPYAVILFSLLLSRIKHFFWLCASSFFSFISSHGENFLFVRRHRSNSTSFEERTKIHFSKNGIWEDNEIITISTLQAWRVCARIFYSNAAEWSSYPCACVRWRCTFCLCVTLFWFSLRTRNTWNENSITALRNS